MPMKPPRTWVVVWKTMIASTASARTPSSAGRYVMPAERGLASFLAELAHRVEEGLGERGEGLDHVVHDLERDLAANGGGGLLEPLARLRAEGVGARERLAVGDERHEVRPVGVL